MATISIVAPASNARVKGTVEVRARITGGTSVSDVVIEIGMPEYGTFPAGRRTDGDWSCFWDTTKKLLDRTTPIPTDELFWITARATVDGVRISATYVPVITANIADPTLPAGGWRSALAWSANYSSTWAQWEASYSATIGAAYAKLVNDPTGRSRKVICASVPNSAKDDADQPNNTTVRFQAASKRNIVEGDEFCVGFSFMPSADFPSVYPAKDPANPNGTAATGYIALFQFYGPPYVQGSPLVFYAYRPAITDPLDEFTIRGNELNAGDPWPLFAIPYQRGRWTDVVFRIKASQSIEKGWMELYVNQGATTTVQAKPFVNGLVRVPRVLLRSDSEEFRTDMQLYRVSDRFENVTVWHTGHKVAQTVADADPKSYRTGWRY